MNLKQTNAAAIAGWIMLIFIVNVKNYLTIVMC